jgi:oligopeptide transport system substrate-binding protein
VFKFLPPFALVAMLIAATVLTDRPAPRADFTFINTGDALTLDVTQQSWMQDLRITRILFEGLVSNDVFSWDYATRPGVAESWELSPDGLTYTFRFRENARWSNGERVRPADFLYAWRRVLLPELGADYAKLFDPIRGASAFTAWRAGALATFAALPSDAVRAGEEGDAAWSALRRGLARAQASARDAARDRPSVNAGAPVEPVDLGFLVDEARARGVNTPARAELAGLLWRATERRFAETVGLESPDERTLIVRLKAPTAYFLDLVAFPTYSPVYAPLVRQHERVDPATGMVKTEAGWTQPPVMVSNGPFMLVTWRFKRDMRMEANPHYWDAASLPIRTIQIPSIEDPNAAVIAFKTGAVDWVSDVKADYRADMLRLKREFYQEPAVRPLYERLLAEGLDPVEIDRRLPADPKKRNHVHAFPAFGTYFYNFNCRPRLGDGRENPFRDPRVRRAFALALDRGVIPEQIRRLGEPAARALVPPGSIPGYTGPAGLVHDPEAARELLAQAGFPGGAGFITVEILFNKDAGHDLIAAAIAKQWRAALGVNVALAQKEIKVFRDDLKGGNFMASRAAWYGDYGDPATFLELNRTGDGNNDRRYSNAEYDALLDQAKAQTDTAARFATLAQAERIIVERDLPLIPIFHYVQVHLFDPHRFTGISSHPRSEQDLARIDVFGDGLGADEPLRLPPRRRGADDRSAQ